MAFERLVLLAFSISIAVISMKPAPAYAANPIRCTVIIDEKTGETIYRQGNCDQGFYPQSTFKLPLAMMGYDSSILVDEHNPLWTYDPKLRRPQREQKDTDPTIWERDSIVWYSQALTRKLGKRAFADYVRRFGYGNEDVSGGPDNTDGLTESWLMSSLRISAEDQVQFLRRFRTGRLPISQRARQMTEAIIPHFEAADGWDIQGKTGAGWLRNAAGKTNYERPLGWFVGWATKGDRRLIFARLYIANHRYADNPISFETRDTLVADFPGLVEDR